MARFTYKAMDAQSRFVTGELDAGDPKEVARELEKLGYVMLNVIAGTGADATAAKKSLFGLRRPAGRRETTVLLREMALVLKAGVALDEALLLLSGEESAGLAQVLRDLRVAISSGASFGDALERHPRLFGADLVAMVRIAEASGNLAAVLESVGEERARTERLLDKISSALRYPAFLLLVAVSVLAFFLVVVVPQFGSVLRDFGKSPDGLAGFVLDASDFMVANGTTILAVVIAVIAIAFLALRRPKIRAAAMRYVNRLPGLRGILELRRTVLFCSSLGTLLGNGVTLSAALRVLADLPGGLSGGLDRVVERVRRGGRLVDALNAVGYIPPLAAKMLRVGEESGELVIVARRTAEFYEAKLSDRLDRLAGIIGPAAIVLIATIVGTLIVSILSALMSVNQLIG